MTNKLRESLVRVQILPLSWLLLIFCLLVGAPEATARKSSSPKRESHYAKLDGSRIHYDNYGKGREALVFIHGWTCNLDYWRDQIPDFVQRNRVIAIDLPGHGQSDKPKIAYTEDPFWPADTEQFYSSIAPNLEFQMWDGVGHFLMMEKPKEFNDAVKAFLDKNALLKK